MRLEIVIRVSEEKVVVEVPEKGWRKEFGNLILLTEDNKFLAFGETNEELQERRKIYPGSKIAEVFNFLAFDPELATIGLAYYLVHTFQANHTSIRKYANQIVLRLKMPGRYQSITKETREQFEYRIQAALRLHTLDVNGQTSWRYGHRWFIVRVYPLVLLISTMLCTFAVLRMFSLLFPGFSNKEIESIGDFLVAFMIILPVGLLTIAIIYFAAYLVSLFILRFFFPKRLFELAIKPPLSARLENGADILISLANRILLDEPPFGNRLK